MTNTERSPQTLPQSQKPSRILGVCILSEEQSEGCHSIQIDNFVVVLEDRTADPESPIEICRCREPQHAPLDHAWFFFFLQNRIAEIPKLLFPAERW